MYAIYRLHRGAEIYQGSLFALSAETALTYWLAAHEPWSDQVMRVESVKDESSANYRVHSDERCDCYFLVSIL